MTKNILFIGDSISSLKIKSDSSLAFVQSALNKNYRVFWCEDTDVEFNWDKIWIGSSQKIKHIYESNIEYESYKEPMAFEDFDLCLIRKDPPFDANYQKLCWILHTQKKVRIYNHPSSLLSYHEKSLHWQALHEGIISFENTIPTCLSSSIQRIKEFIAKGQRTGIQKWICKPWLGHGGQGVQLFDNAEELIHTFENNHNDPLLIQPYLEDIQTQGDRRVFVIHGQIIFDFVRFPATGQIASNLAQGGKAQLQPMTESQVKLCKKIGDFLVKKSIAIAGIDLIGDKVGEINITSPTGIRTFESLSGQKITPTLFDLLEKTP